MLPVVKSRIRRAPPPAGGVEVCRLTGDPLSPRVLALRITSTYRKANPVSIARDPSYVVVHGPREGGCPPGAALQRRGPAWPRARPGPRPPGRAASPRRSGSAGLGSCGSPRAPRPRGGGAPAGATGRGGGQVHAREAWSPG